MKLHEFQGKEILKEAKIRLPESSLAYFPDEAWMHSMQIGFPCMLKSQVLAGGRGKAGGIKKCNSADEVLKVARQLFGNGLSTKQTGSQKLAVRKLLVEKCIVIEKEFYFSIIIDSDSRSPLLIVSAEGGAEIEEISAKSPQAILKVPVNPYTGLQSFHVREVLAHLGLPGNRQEYFDFFQKIYGIFMQYEALLLELNPLVLDDTGALIPVDIKLDIDENALFRQPAVLKMRDLSELDPFEIEARFAGLNFIKLDGNVGCMVNGAGLAMATMDFIKMAGASPANFLDVGGVATPETISKGFEILLKDKAIRAIFINIFGGIVRCDKVAAGIVAAAENLKVEIPVIIRLSGSNLEEALQLLAKSRFSFKLAKTVEEASVILNEIFNPKAEEK